MIGPKTHSVSGSLMLVLLVAVGCQTTNPTRSTSLPSQTHTPSVEKSLSAIEKNKIGTAALEVVAPESESRYPLSKRVQSTADYRSKSKLQTVGFEQQKCAEKEMIRQTPFEKLVFFADDPKEVGQKEVTEIDQTDANISLVEKKVTLEQPAPSSTNIDQTKDVSMVPKKLALEQPAPSSTETEAEGVRIAKNVLEKVAATDTLDQETANPTVPSSQSENESATNSDASDPTSALTGTNDPPPVPQLGEEIVVGKLPIDFPSVLRLAGADNWNVRIAQERICEAIANYRSARAAWLPSLNFGIGYNHHEGEIQATEGVVSTVSRGSLFVGGGAKVGSFPMAGGSGGPSRLTVDLSLTDSYFLPLAAKQLVSAERLRKSRVFNDTMLESSLAYFELVRAQSQMAVSQENQREAEVVQKLTTGFVEAGKGSLADSNRMQVIVNQRRRDVAAATAQVGVASSQLATVLQMDRTKLDPGVGLVAMEEEVVPIDLIAPEIELAALVDQALCTRQEIHEAQMRAEAAKTQLTAEQWRPYLPNLSAGLSNGFFGGGTGGDLPKLDYRNDIDLQMTWEVRNLGVGNKAARGARRSQFNQSLFVSRQIKDQIADEVATAYHQSRRFSETMLILQHNIEQAKNALRLNIESIKGLEGLPLESVQSLDALAIARTEYLDAVIDYNRSQLQLMRAIGEPIANNP